MTLLDPELPTNRKFGFFFTAVFFICGSYFVVQDSFFVSYAFFALAASFLLTTLLKAELLLPLNKLWMSLGLLLGMIVSPIVLGIIFFGMFTPISQLMKLFGRDELRLKLKNRGSHWRLKELTSTSPESFKNQF